MIKGLYEAHLPVSNVDRSIAFYQSRSSWHITGWPTQKSTSLIPMATVWS